MIGPLNWIDLLFLATIVLLIFNGFRNGAVFSLINLLSIPIAIGVAYFFGKPFALFFAKNGLSSLTSHFIHCAILCHNSGDSNYWYKHAWSS